VRLPQTLAVQASHVSRDHVASRDHPDDAGRVVASDDRKPADLLSRHVIGRVSRVTSRRTPPLLVV
jgi:hypothetical protein